MGTESKGERGRWKEIVREGEKEGEATREIWRERERYVPKCQRLSSSAC